MAMIRILHYDITKTPNMMSGLTPNPTVGRMTIIIVS